MFRSTYSEMQHMENERNLVRAVIEISRHVESIKRLDSAGRLYELGALTKDDYIGFCQDVMNLKGIRMG